MNESDEKLETWSVEDVLESLTEDELKRLHCSTDFTNFNREKLDKDSKKNWDLFYKRNGDRFFKNRYWTKHEFSEIFITGDDRRTLLEIGCGCGDFALPLLENSNENLYVYCCDISDQAIRILSSNPLYQKNNPSRIHAFVADITKKLDPFVENLRGQLVDMISLVFVLSALDPNQMTNAVSNLFQLMKPGSTIFFRDYAIYDKAMLRFNEKSKICDQFYVRQDGTRAYFFTKEQLKALFEGCKFKVQYIDYVRRETYNNTTKDRYSRIFVQAKFTKHLV